MLKQPQYTPLPIEEQVVTIFAGVNGYTDAIEVNQVTQFEARLLDEIRSKGQDILKAIRTEKELSEETQAKLTKFMDDFTKTYA